ncbi:hypothetical protein [Azospirillum sp. sgz301742]
MRDTARLAAMDDPAVNFHFRRGMSWDVPDRLPGSAPRRRLKGQTLDNLAAEIAADLRRAIRGRA